MDTSVNVAALLQEQLTTFLLSPRVSLDRSHVELMVTSASFVSRFMSYHDQWQMQHPSSLAHLYHAMCALIHVAACFLIRPSYLGMLVSLLVDNMGTITRWMARQGLDTKSNLCLPVVQALSCPCPITSHVQSLSNRCPILVQSLSSLC